MRNLHLPMRYCFINPDPGASALGKEKQKEIWDSIHFAKRIQQSLLPTERYISKILLQLNK
jgi:hypothetical protein